MPAKLDRCVKKIKAKIASGKTPKKSNPWAICKASLKKKKQTKPKRRKK